MLFWIMEFSLNKFFSTTLFSAWTNFASVGNTICCSTQKWANKEINKINNSKINSKLIVHKNQEGRKLRMTIWDLGLCATTFIGFWGTLFTKEKEG